jgi:hypothetical protein
MEEGLFVLTCFQDDDADDEQYDDPKHRIFIPPALNRRHSQRSVILDRTAYQQGKGRNGAGTTESHLTTFRLVMNFGNAFLWIGFSWATAYPPIAATGKGLNLILKPLARSIPKTTRYYPS